MAFNASIIITGIADSARAAAEGLGKAFEGAGKGAATLVRGLSQVSNVNNQVRASVNQANNALNDFQSILSGVVTARTLIEIYRVRNLFVGWENQLTAITGSSQKAQDQMESMIGTVKELGVDLKTAAAGFVQLQAAAKGSGVSTSDLNEVFKSFSGALNLFNADTLKIEGTFRALTQMFSKGVVQAEELRGQLAEHLPGALQLAARALGKTTWEMSDLMKKGLILPQDLVPKMAAQIQKEMGFAIKLASETARGAYNRLITETDLLLNEIGKTFEKEFIDIVNTIAKGMIAIKDLFKDSNLEIKMVVGALGGYAVAWLAVASAIGVFRLALAAATIQTWLFGAAVAAIPGVRLFGALVSIIGILGGAIYAARDAVVSFNGASASIANWFIAGYEAAVKFFDYVESKAKAYEEYINSNSMQVLPVPYDEGTRRINNIVNTTGDTSWIEDSIRLTNQYSTVVSQLFQSIWDWNARLTPANWAIKALRPAQGYFAYVREGFQSIMDWNASWTPMLWIPGAQNQLASFFDFAMRGFNDLIEWNARWTPINWLPDAESAFSDFFDFVSGIIADIATMFGGMFDGIAARAQELENQQIFQSLVDADLLNVAQALGLLPEQMAAANKAFEKLHDALSTKTEESIRKTEEYREELRLLRTLGFEATQKAMITYRANMQALIDTQSLLSTNIHMQPGRQPEFDAAMRGIEARRLALIAEGNAELEIQRARTEARKSLKEEEKYSRDAGKALYDLRQAFLDLGVTIIETDAALRDHAYMYDELTANALRYADALGDISVASTTPLPTQETIGSPLAQTIDTAEFDSYVERLRSMDPIMIPIGFITDNALDVDKVLADQGIVQRVLDIAVEFQVPVSGVKSILDDITNLRAMDPVEIPVEFKTDNTLDLDKVIESFKMGAEEIRNSSGSVNTSLDEIQRTAQQTDMTLKDLGVTFTALANVKDHTAANLQLVADAKNKLQDAYNNVIALEKQYGDVRNMTVGQEEKYRQAVDGVTNALQRYQSVRQVQLQDDLIAIRLGVQQTYSYKRTQTELNSLADTYNTAAARAGQYRVALADIQDLIDNNLMTDYEANVAKMQASIDAMHPLARSIGEAFNDAFKSLIDGSASAEEAIKNMLKGIADAVYEELVAKQIVAIIGSLFSGGFGGSTGGANTPFYLTKPWAEGGIMSDTGPVSLKSFADGGIAGNPNAISFMKAANDSVNFKAYSSGGVTSKPMLSLFGEGTTPEAYVPLPDGRSIPVTMKAEGTTPSNANQTKPEVKVVVNNLPGQNAEVSRDNQGGLTIDIVRASLATDVNKGGVPWVGAMERRYGMSRGHAR